LDLHVPAQFSDARPAFVYRTAEWEGNINDHPVAVKIPRATDSPSIHAFRDDLAPLISDTNVPRTLDDWIYSDDPQLFFEQINFHDATVIMTMFPHHLMDATGYGIFLKAWSAVLRGNMDMVPPLCSFSSDLDPFNVLAGNTPPERSIWHKHIMSGLDALIFGIRFIWDNLWKKEDRLVCVPGWFIDRMRECAIEQLRTSQKTPFVSEGDILAAWFSRLVTRAVNPSQNRPFMLMNAFDIRPIVLDLHYASVMNSILLSYVRLPMSEVLSQPVSFTASGIRAALVRDRTAEEIQARVTWSHEVGRCPPIGSSNMFVCGITNWNKASCFGLDLSPAVSKKRPSSASHCTPSAFLSYTRVPRYFCDFCVVLGKDSGRNWWMQWNLSKSTWTKVEEHLHSIKQRP
jgi:hypothetical protein